MVTRNHKFDAQEAQYNKQIEQICKEHGAEFLEGVSAAAYTTFKIGGKCNIVKVNGVEVLRAVTAFCKGESVAFRILGRGSNVLISEDGLDGVVLLMDSDFGEIGIDGATVNCMAGANLSAVCKAAAARSLTGMEFAYGIPGTIGGALYMNAGAYGGEMKDIVESCEYMDFGGEALAGADREAEDNPANLNLDIKRIGVKEMGLSYRNSVFRLKDRVITSVRLKLKQGVESQIKAKMDEIFTARRDKQPLEFHSAGSTFKRPTGMFASKLIEDCGLKGRTIGGAQVSEKHAGFIINKGGATFDDVVKLINAVRDEVLNKTGVTLENEVIIWD